MFESSSRANLRHSLPSVALVKKQDESASPAGQIRDKRTSATASGRSDNANLRRPDTFRAPNSSLKSRIPWLETRNSSRCSSSSNSSKKDALTSTSQAKLLPMIDVSPVELRQETGSPLSSPRKRMSIIPGSTRQPTSPIFDEIFHEIDLSPPSSGSTVDNTRQASPVSPAGIAKSKTEGIRPTPFHGIAVSPAAADEDLRNKLAPSESAPQASPSQPDLRGNESPSGKIPLPNKSARKSSIKIQLQPAKVGNLKPRTEVTPSIDAKERKRSLFDSIYTSRGPPSPEFRDDPNDSLPEMDTSGLDHAIRRTETLVAEAESLTMDADNAVYDEQAHNIKESSNVGQISSSITSSLAVGADMTKDSPTSPDTQQRDFLIEADVSDLSLDSDEDSAVKTPVRFYKPSWKEPAVRDFALPSTSEPKSRKASEASEHWVCRRPTITKPVSRRSVQLEDVPDVATKNGEHTAYIAESSPSPASQTLRQRKKSVQIAEKEDKELSPRQNWRPPRHNSLWTNTYYDPSWQPDLNPPSPKPGPRRPSNTPVPWSEKIKQRRGQHQRLGSGDKTENRDVEKAGSSGARIQGKRRWHLGHARTEPVARKWSILRKRISALVACLNTGIVGYIVGVYAGMVPRIQYQLADQKHDVLLGNIFLFIGLAISTFLFWPLPLLHGRRPYILASLGLAIPLQFPQAILVSQYRPPVIFGFEFGLLSCRFVTGLLLGLTNINDFATLLDCFGASLQSERPHQEIVQYDDVRREGGGIGLWLGIWAWCWVGSISLGFLSGAGIIGVSNPSWGFYITVVLMVLVLVLNVIAPETRHSSLRRTLRDLKSGGRHEERSARKVARGEIKLHISDEGPRYWFQELWAGIILSKRMFFQRGFSVLSLYLGWIYGQNVLVIVLLGALLSREYKFPSKYVGLGVLSISIGALLAVPLTHAGLFSRARKAGPRTDSMTFEHQVTWSSHMIRRIIFMLMLPICGVVYTVVSPGVGVHWSIPMAFAGAIGFFDSLAVAECYGLVMETYDTSDLQPGVNSRHRLQSLAENVRRRRTNYSSFPRVSAGIFVSQSLGFLFAAAATGVGGAMTRDLGAQYSTGITAGVLFFLTVALTGALVRYKSVQVIPNHAFGTAMMEGEVEDKDEFWKPVVLGNPSGKIRRMNVLELGKLSRWSEIRRLNKLT